MIAFCAICFFFFLGYKCYLGYFILGVFENLADFVSLNRPVWPVLGGGKLPQTFLLKS